MSSIGPVVSEEKMFENVVRPSVVRLKMLTDDGRTDGGTTDAGVTGILLAHQ